jgi:preprotein translocase subunit SecE
LALEAVFKYENMNKLASYLKSSIEEMKKVTWPTKKETYNYTLMVIGISLGVALFLGVLDYLFNLGLEQLIYGI